MKNLKGKIGLDYSKVARHSLKGLKKTTKTTFVRIADLGNPGPKPGQTQSMYYYIKSSFASNIKGFWIEKNETERDDDRFYVVRLHSLRKLCFNAILGNAANI